MKNMKKILALVLVALLVVANVAAFAEDQTYNLTISNSDGITDAVDHVYVAYQILTGEISGTEGNYTLSNMKWGTNAPSGKTSSAELTKEETEALRSWTVADVEPTGTSNITAVKNGSNYVFEGLAAGYYVVKDETQLAADANDANSKIIVQVVGDTSVTTKRAIPTVDKEVSDDETGDGWSEAADHELYEQFQFKLTATIPADADYDAYETYKVVFHDTMSKGVAFDRIDTVTVGGTEIASSAYTSTASTEANNGTAASSFTVTIADVKPLLPSGTSLTAGTTVVVTYTAHLTKDVETFYKASTDPATPSKNEVYLEYSNNPDATGNGETGTTEKDTVWVFNYEVDNTKWDATVEEAKVRLANAGFRLYDEAGTTEIPLIYDAGLAAYRPIAAGETGEEMFSKNADDNTKGIFNIKGVDEGIYTLKETTTPTGFNTMADMTIKIEATTVENESGANAKLTLSDDSNTINDVNNKKGVNLPSTGGMGTTILYVGGSILVVLAAILLITKRRMSSED